MSHRHFLCKQWITLKKPIGRRCTTHPSCSSWPCDWLSWLLYLPLSLWWGQQVFWCEIIGMCTRVTWSRRGQKIAAGAESAHLSKWLLPLVMWLPTCVLCSISRRDFRQCMWPTLARSLITAFAASSMLVYCGFQNGSSTFHLLSLTAVDGCSVPPFQAFSGWCGASFSRAHWKAEIQPEVITYTPREHKACTTCLQHVSSLVYNALHLLFPVQPLHELCQAPPQQPPSLDRVHDWRHHCTRSTSTERNWCCP